MKLIYKLLIIAAVLVCGLLLSQSNAISLYILSPAIFSPAVIAMLAVFGLLGCLFWFWYKLVIWAKQRKTGAVIFGAAVQMLLPDPYAERTIKIVQERKYENKKQQQNKGKLPDD